MFRKLKVLTEVYTGIDLLNVLLVIRWPIVGAMVFMLGAIFGYYQGTMHCWPEMAP